MLRLVLSLSCLSLALTSAAKAGPMPELPALPPLPTNYVSQNDPAALVPPFKGDHESDGISGAYAGILTGYSGGPDAGLGIALVVGNTFAAADLLLGGEAMAIATTHGKVMLEGSVRAGFAVTDTISIFASTGLGYSFDADAFVSVGTSLEANVGSGWLVRADYRYNHDLSGDPGTHRILAGLLHKF